MEESIFEFAKQHHDYPIRKSEYDIDGKNYTVTGYFVGSKDINKVIYEVAFIRALNEVLKAERKKQQNRVLKHRNSLKMYYNMSVE